MTRRMIAFLLLAVCCALPLTACSVAPRGKTIVLERPAPSPTATPAPSGALSFQLERASVIALDRLDQAGWFAGRAGGLVFGWLDNDHLAAIGVKLSAAQPGDTAAPDEAPAPEIKKNLMILRAKGVTGQVLSVDWQTGEAVELHTVRDEVITALGLDNDKQRLWYTSMDGEGYGKLSVSDVSFTHELLEVPDYFGMQPFWSSHDKYLGYLSKSQLELFDGVSTLSIPLRGLGFNSPGLLYIDDSTDRLLAIADMTLLLTIWLPTGQQPAAFDPEGSKLSAPIPEEVIYGKIPGVQWVDSEYLAYISVDKTGQALQVSGTGVEGSSARYEGVINFAFSDDRKYVCLARETNSGTADVIVAEWRDGRIINEKLVFRDFVATGSIFFSPDNSKLYLEGSYRYASAQTVGMVLKFR